MTYGFAEIERNKGKIETFMQLIKDGLITLQQALERMNITEEIKLQTIYCE